MKQLINIDSAILKERGEGNYEISVPEGSLISNAPGVDFLPANGTVVLNDNDFLGTLGNRAIMKDDVNVMVHYLNKALETQTIQMDGKQFADMMNNKWSSFTITKKQVINSWTNSHGIKRAFIIIPSSNLEYGGCMATVSFGCLKEVEKNDNIFRVVVPSTVSFSILRPTILGTNELGKNIYGDNEVVAKLFGHQLANLFNPFAHKQELTQEQSVTADQELTQEQSVAADQVLPDTMGNGEIFAGPDGKIGTADDIINPDRTAEEIEKGIQNGEGITR